MSTCELDEVEDDRLEFAVVEEIDDDAEVRNAVRRRPPVEADVMLPQEFLHFCQNRCERRQAPSHTCRKSLTLFLEMEKISLTSRETVVLEGSAADLSNMWTISCRYLSLTMLNGRYECATHRPTSIRSFAGVNVLPRANESIFGWPSVCFPVHFKTWLTRLLVDVS